MVVLKSFNLNDLLMTFAKKTYIQANTQLSALRAVEY